MVKKRMAAPLLVGLGLLLSVPLAAMPPGGNMGGHGTPPSGPGWIAYNDAGYITLMNPDGTGVAPVAATDSAGKKFGIHDRKPAWTPMLSDGSVWLSYPVYDSTSSSHLLMVVQVFPSLGSPMPILEKIGGIFQVDWSPAVSLADGTDSVRVAFATFPSSTPPAGDSVVHVVDLIYDPIDSSFTPDPAAPGPLVLDAGPGAYYWQARFSPDGQWLVLGRGGPLLPDGNYHASIWLAAADGSVQMPLIDEPAVYNWYPAWSPDGSQLAFISDRDGRPEIYVATFDTTTGTVGSVQQATNSRRTAEKWPTWSPDGLQIAYFEDGRTGEVGKVLATSEQFQLVEGQWPAWSRIDLPRLP
jgi:hypothetical protein